MAIDLWIGFNNRIHYSSTGLISAASSTAAGYAKENVQQDNLASAWKPTDPSTVDEWVRADGGTTTWLGNASDTAFWAVAFDLRGADQTSVKLHYYTDEVAFTGPTLVANFASQEKTGVKCGMNQFTIPGTAKRYYQLTQLNADRGGTNHPGKILYWGLYSAADYFRLSIDKTNMGEGPYEFSQVYRAGEVRTAGGHVYFNRWASTGYRFTIAFNATNPADDAFFKDTWLLPLLEGENGNQTALFIQKEGLRGGAKFGGVAQPQFRARLVGAEVRARRPFPNQYNVELEFETEPWI